MSFVTSANQTINDSFATTSSHFEIGPRAYRHNVNYAENGRSLAQFPAINFRESPVRPAWQDPILPYDASHRDPYRFTQGIGPWTETSAAQTFGVSSSNRVSDSGGIHRSQYTSLIQPAALFDSDNRHLEYHIPPPALLEQGGARIRRRDKAHAATIALAAYSTTADVGVSSAAFGNPRSDARTSGSRSYVLCGADDVVNHAANYAEFNADDSAADQAADAADSNAAADAVAVDYVADEDSGWTCPPRAWLEGGDE